MAGVKRSQIRVNDHSFANFRLNRIPFVLLVISGTLQHPVIEKVSENNIIPLFQRQWLQNPADDSWAQLYDLMMKPPSHSETEFIRESRDSTQDYQYEPVDSDLDSSVDNVLTDNDDYINQLNNIDMDNLSSNKNNVSILDNGELTSVKPSQESILVTWNTSTVSVGWWSVCQLPVLIILLAVIGVLAVSTVVVLWFRYQMLENKKQKKLTSSSSSHQMQLMGSGCPCPSPSMVPEEPWIRHTVINLHSAEESSTTQAVHVQPPMTDNLPEIYTKRDDVQSRPDVIRVRSKGLLERRGSSASLTIDLTHPVYDSKLQMVTPTRECTSEEFLLSAGNILSRAQLKNCLNNVHTLHSEFWDIPLNHPEKPVVTGSGTKNRYETILPNERTRVRLTDDENSLESYINANYIRGYDGEEKAYIATQGPLPNTIQDLYQMAWNEKSPIIVMITKLFEKSKTKCESYFPMETGECIKYGDFEVTVISITLKQGYSVRELLVTNRSETRRILHYWYDSWPDHKTPQNAQSIVALVNDVDKYRNSFKSPGVQNNNENQTVCNGPVIVHCSAGIGRTGCFIAISHAICQLLAENKVDILGIVCQMRYDRGGMIQTAEQYEFVHRAVALFELTLPETSGE